MRNIGLGMLGAGLLLAACAPAGDNNTAPVSGQVVREGGRPAEARATAPPPPGTPIMNTNPSTGPAR
jgi:hypothetical protein